MTEMAINIKMVAGLIGATLGSFLGGVDGLVIALIIFVVADYLTGVLCAAKQKTINSKKGFWGIMKKILIFALVGIANIIDVHVIQTGAVLRASVIFFYLSNEGISILENMDCLGIPIPEKIRKIMKQITDDTKETENSDTKE